MSVMVYSAPPVPIRLISASTSGASLSRVYVFVSPRASQPATMAPVAPCLIRLTWDGHDLCLRDYKAIEVNWAERRHTVRLGVEFARSVDSQSLHLLSSLEPGQVVMLDTILGGGFKGSYFVRDISSVALAKRVTYDILLEGGGADV